MTEVDLQTEGLALLLNLRRSFKAEITTDASDQEAYRHIESTIAYLVKHKKDLVAIQYELARLLGCISRLSMGGFRFKTDQSQAAWTAVSDFFNGPKLKAYRPDKVFICLD